MSSTRRGATLRQIPAGIWVLGFVSMLMDISSEMIHSLLPLFMVSTLGASALTVGLIEGRIFAVVYTQRPDVIRLISARRCNAKEARLYGKI